MRTEKEYEVIDRFFKKFNAIFPVNKARFKTAEDAEEIKELWMDAFETSGVTLDEIKKGLDYYLLDSSGFMPTVGQFISTCKSGRKTSKMPPLRNFYNEMALGYQNPLIYATVARIGVSKMKNLPSDKAESEIKKVYEEVLAEHERGVVFELPKPVPAITDTFTMTDEMREKRLKEIEEFKKNFEENFVINKK